MFDIDDTLTHSYEEPAQELVADLDSLIARIPVAIVSAASFTRIEKHFLSVLVSHQKEGKLYIFSNNASQCFLFRNSQWELEYAFGMTDEERGSIKAAISESAAELGIEHNVIDRETKIVYHGVSNDAHQDIKKAWDPDMAKRSGMKSALEKRISGYEILIGGTHTLDITKQGVNKSYAVEWLAKDLKVAPAEMLFVGDALYEGGNDAVVIPTGIQTRQVAGPHETHVLIKELLTL